MEAAGTGLTPLTKPSAVLGATGNGAQPKGRAPRKFCSVHARGVQTPGARRPR
jgi:hypothetical protein